MCELHPILRGQNGFLMTAGREKISFVIGCNSVAHSVSRQSLPKSCSFIDKIRHNSAGKKYFLPKYHGNILM